MRERGMTSATPPPDGPIARGSIVSRGYDAAIRESFAST
jgi:hypothetical protein